MSPVWPYCGDWTADDSGAANAEGWDVFMCGDSEHEPWEIQRVDFPEDGDARFGSDPDVWRHVVDRAAAGSTVHNRALLYLATHSPGEFLHIGRWLAGDGDGQLIPFPASEGDMTDDDIVRLERLLVEHGDSEADLDELVHDLKSQEATAINNGGLAEQLRFIVARLGVGGAEQLIREQVDEYPGSPPRHFELERNNLQPLEFDGWVLVREDSRPPGVRRSEVWSNVYVYRTTAGKWVVAHVRQTLDPTAPPSSMLRVCDSPAAVVAALQVREGYMTKVGRRALKKSIAADPDLEPAQKELG